MLENNFTHETTRIKSCAFHPQKPIFITAHHDGSIKIYNYLLKLRLCTLTEHIGPVRAIIFHPFLEIFASGGDDTKIRIWDFRTKKVLTTFSDHKDYIRGLDFHPTQPYILSCSDDQTIRIYNFQNKRLLSTMIGHTHYVMGCKFFLDTFILSVSLDQSIRLWDYKNLHSEKKGFLSLPNVTVKQIIEGHEKGINGLSVYKNQFCTVSDDREIKLWEFEGLISLKDTFYQHSNIVSSVILNQNNIISNGEDGLICKYEFNTKTMVKFTLETRFWCLSEKEGLLLAGHDNGFILFNSKIEKPIFLFKEGLYYAKNKDLFFNDLKNEKKINSFKRTIKSIQVNELNELILIQFENTFEILKNGTLSIIQGKGQAIITDKNILIINNSLKFLNCKGDFIKELEFNYDNLFFHKKNKLIAKKGNNLILLDFDLKVLNQKGCFDFNNFLSNDYNSENKLIAIWNEKEIWLLDEDFKLINNVKELIPINSCLFYEDTLIYSTKTQIKYLNSEKGILKSEENSFIFHLNGNKLYFLRDEVISCELDLTELRFVLNLQRNELEEVKNVIKNGELLGLYSLNTLIKYNQGDLALDYVTDLYYKFKMALSTKKYAMCYEFCDELEEENLNELANETIKDCCLEIAEKCLIKLKDDKRLFLLYLCGNQTEKIKEKIEFFGEEVKILAKRVFSLKGGSIKNELNKSELNKSELIKNELNKSKLDKSKLDKSESVKDQLKANKTIKDQLKANKTVNNTIKDELKANKTIKDELKANKTVNDKTVKNQLKELNINNEWNEELIQFIKQGKFNIAIKKLKESLKLKPNKETGKLLCALLAERARKKNEDSQLAIEATRYFTEINLPEEVRELVINNAMRVAFKNKNYDDAKEFAEKINNKFSEEVLNSSFKGNKYLREGDVFCLDFMKYKEGGIECERCGVSSVEEGKCCCELL